MIKLTPAMQQFVDIKKQYPDCILFFRLGDFYETFREDAKICSKVLDLVLTSKNKNSENPIPMAGIPHHSAEKYINKLVQKGYKIAIAEQMTDPVPGKVVEREVVSIITPGTYIQEQDSNFIYMMSICFSTDKDTMAYHIAWGDFSIGSYQTKSFSDIQDMQKFILRVQPREIILDIDFPEKEAIQSSIKYFSNALISIYDKPFAVVEYILQQCNVQTLNSFGEATKGGRADAFALLLNYLKNTQKTNLDNIVKVAYHSDDDKVIFDETTLKNLEIFSSSYENNEKYSLYGVINTTKTAGGARLLRDILSTPIKNQQTLKERLNHISYYYEHNHLTEHIHKLLGNLGDLHKLTSSIIYKKLLITPFIKLRSLLELVLDDETCSQEVVRLSYEDLDQIKAVANYLRYWFKDDVTNPNAEFVNDGVDEHIDQLRKIAYHSDDLLLQYQQELVKYTGISNIKIKFISNQGYFLELSPKDIASFEAKAVQGDEKYDFIRRQTLKSCQRYSSPYLETLQIKILEARDELQQRETEILNQAKEEITTTIKPLTEFGNILAYLDVYSSHALYAKDKQLIRPQLTNTATVIKQGRHLVIEQFLENNEHFISNDLVIGDEEHGIIHIITGPNMGGKSTYLRQNALIVLMAHCGFFVPCQEATITLTDGIFARVGSGDIIAKNQSTFMTEMIEVVNILNNATKKSFIIFDELGRGTSTYDGLALTKAILEYIATTLQATTLIATHYHELIHLAKTYPNVKNFSVSVYETDREVVFMKKIVSGGASKSYGIDVAKLAGLPESILQQARANLSHLQQGQNDPTTPLSSSSSATGLFTPPPSSEKNKQYEKIKSILESFDVNKITPLQALQLLDKLKGEI